MRNDDAFDVVMLGTFSLWRLGTLQARALPFAKSLRHQGVRAAILTVPWDRPQEAGVWDSIGGVPVGNTRHVAAWRALSAARDLDREVRRLRPRLVHVFKPKGFGGLAAMSIARHIPVAVDSDDWEGDGGWNRRAGYNAALRKLFDWQERSLLTSAAAVTAASTLLARRAETLRAGRSTGGVWRVPNGLERGWIEQLACGRGDTQRTDDADVVTIYSRFEEFSPDWLPMFGSALAELAPAPITLRLVGPAPVHALSPSERLTVDARGYVARDELPRVLGSSTLAIYPCDDSLIGRSKQSVKLLEMMAAGCPVVAHDIGDVAATLGPAGVVIPSGDPRAMAATVAELLGSRGRLAAMSLAGPGRVRDHFDVAVLTAKLLDAYRSCAPGFGSSGVVP